MGNDGGSIPTRRELVKEGAKDLTVTQLKEIQTEKQEHFWSTCALSHDPLVPPIVADGLGTLYNKAAVLDYLLQKPESDGANPDRKAAVDLGRQQPFTVRLNTLKDVVEVRFSADNSSSKSSSDSSIGGNQWICPITNKRLGPGTRAVYLVPCGHAFADSVIKEMESGNRCLTCDQAYENDNIIPILPTTEAEKDRLQARLVRLGDERLSHSLKKTSSGGKKRKTAEKATEGGQGPIEATHPSSKQKCESENGKPLSFAEKRAVEKRDMLRDAATASLVTKVLAEQDAQKKKAKTAQNANVQSLYSKSSNQQGKNVDFMTRGFSIPAKPQR